MLEAGLLPMLRQPAANVATRHYVVSELSLRVGELMARCADCGRLYGSEHGFPDLIIPIGAWRRISPTGDEGGLLCPSCICARLHDAGIQCIGAFMSGPVKSVDPDLMWVRRMTENILEREQSANSEKDKP